jgi:predicted aldo/keto reductase-like oxidoreductase
MQYRVNPKNGNELSLLGFGCMRFPNGQEKINALVKTAFDGGVNYFDTAYIYPNNEVALGNAVSTLKIRDKIFIATKMPLMFCKKPEDFDKYFSTQLDRLKTDYIDYYLCHMLTDKPLWERLVKLGIVEWAEQKKREGKIRNFGFSFHGGKAAFIDVLNAYDWDFCMIQYNYLDENNQAGYSGLQAAHAKGLPVMVMEPLRGGMLVGKLLPDDAKKDIADNGFSPAEFGVRFVMKHTEVTTMLSGMNAPEQLIENIQTADNITPDFTGNERAVYTKVTAAINRLVKIPCTGCGYCRDCPKGVDVPTCFTEYNESFLPGYMKMMYYQHTGQIASGKRSDAGLCIQCGKCEKHCPQSIPIRDNLKKVHKRLNMPILNVGLALLRKIGVFGKTYQE